MEEKKWSWEKVESEFTSMNENDRLTLYKSLVNMDILCKRCQKAQSKDFHVHSTFFSRGIKRDSYEIGILPYVDKYIADILSGNIPQNIRSLFEEYENECLKANCGNAVKLSNEAYNKFTKLLNSKK